jgi:hypothetical protein
MQKIAFSLFAIAPTLALLAACGSGGTSVDTSTSTSSGAGGSGGMSGDKCPVSASVRILIEETVIENANVAKDVATQSSATQYGFGVQIPGSDKGYVGFTTVNNSCPNNDTVGSCYSAQEPNPSDPFWMVHDRCVQFRCEQGGANIALVDTYLTMQPKKLANDRHVFTYSTTNPTGEAKYDQNPFLTWRIDLTDLAAIQVTAKVGNLVRIDEPDGTSIQFTHTGSLSASRTDADVSLIMVDLEFPSLLKSGDPLTATAQVDAAGGVSGEIKAGTEMLALIKDAFVFSWQGECAP